MESVVWALALHLYAVGTGKETYDFGDQNQRMN